jgi:hypothetical protein
MPRFGLHVRRWQPRADSRALAASCALGALLIGAACGRFGFETLPSEVQPTNILDGSNPDGDVNQALSCSLGTAANCSACGDDCSAHSLPPGVSELACVNRLCTMGSCAPGFEDCNQDPGDGCETSLTTLQSCGACSQPCGFPSSEVSCASGACRFVQCAAGFGDCDSDIATNGCERQLNTLTNCGGCGIACNPPNATPSCASGVCQLSSCANGFDDCDGDPSNGCETPLNTLTDCGSCGTTCFIAGAQDLNCAGGVCSAASCSPGFADCDGDSLSCETDLRTLSDCVSCNVPCGDGSGRLPHASASCASGSCGVGSCDFGFGNCDGSPGNGCESPLDTLVDCGGCNVPCSRANGSETCASGFCQTVSCDPGFDDCDGDDSTGCEAQLGTAAHCGSCTDACGTNQVCSSGSCVGRFLTFQPANVNAGALNSGTAPDVQLDCGTINLDTGSLNGNGWCGRPGPSLVVQKQTNGPDLVVLPMRSLTIAAGSTLRVLGSRPVALVVFGDVNIAGTIDVSANGTAGGAGNHWNCGSSVGSNGGDTSSNGDDNGGGGGGAYGARGGRGGNGGAQQGGNGGQQRGSALLTPLIPGCNGGWGGGCGGAPGGGGGAVELAASGRIDITGNVLARGADGVIGCDATGGATGGGSGGGILIQGNQVFLSGGALIAEGGRGGQGAGGGAGGLGGTSGAGQDGSSAGSKGGGGGGGSTGRIRVSGAQSCSLTGTVSPAASCS